MPITQLKEHNFLAATRKPNMPDYMTDRRQDLSWIAANYPSPVELAVTGSVTGTNGTDGNAVFQLSDNPNGLQMFNGILLTEGIDYTRVGATVTFITGRIPTVGSVLRALSYGGAIANPGVSGTTLGEVPTGTIDGVNPTFTLTNSPAAIKLNLFKNGQRLSSPVAYAISGNTITFAADYIPQVGDDLFASYSL